MIRHLWIHAGVNAWHFHKAVTSTLGPAAKASPTLKGIQIAVVGRAEGGARLSLLPASQANLGAGIGLGADGTPLRFVTALPVARLYRMDEGAFWHVEYVPPDGASTEQRVNFAGARLEEAMRVVERLFGAEVADA